MVSLLVLSWINPSWVESIQPGFFPSIPLIFIAEFVFGHAGVGFSLPVFFDGVKRWLAIVFVTSLYGLFFMVLWKTGQVLTVLTFVWLTISRVYRADLEFVKNSKEKMDRGLLYFSLAMPSFFKLFYLILCTVICMVLPIPQLGISNSGYRFDGSGDFVDRPQNLILALIIYFASTPMMDKKFFPLAIERIKKKFW